MKRLALILIMTVTAFAMLSLYAAASGSDMTDSDGLTQPQTKTDYIKSTVLSDTELITSGDTKNSEDTEDKKDSEDEKDVDDNKEPDWIDSCETLDKIFGMHNISLWKVQEDELYNMHDDKYVLRRSDKAYDSWLVYEIPYVKSLNAVIYTWAKNESELYLYTSSDGESWTECEFDADIQREADRWSKIVFSNNALYGVRYVKLVFPSVDAELDDWWNPYLGEVSAGIGSAEAVSVKTDVPSELTVPRYDSTVYTLKADVIDQLGEVMDIPVRWSAESLPEGVQLTETGELTVASGAAEGAEIVLTAAVESDGLTETLSTELKIRLRASLMGDTNSDLKIDNDDLDFALQSYGKTVKDSGWTEIRLADIDGNGIIDIIDLSYIAYNIEVPSENDEN